MWVKKAILQAQRVGVVKGTENAPDCLVSALFRKDLIKEDKAGAVDAKLGGAVGKRLLDCFLDFR